PPAPSTGRPAETVRSSPADRTAGPPTPPSSSRRRTMHTPSTVTRRTIVLGLGAAAALPLASCVGEGGAPTTAPKGAATGPVEGRVEFWTINLRKNFQMYFEDLISTF